MAKMSVTYSGYETLRAPNEDVFTAEDKIRICRAGAAVLLQKLRDWLTANTSDPNADVRGRLAASLKGKEYPEAGFIIVGPSGKHHGRKSTPRTRAAGYHRPKSGQGKSSKRSHHGMSGAVSAQDVGYYLEYGAPRTEATHWMEETVENCESDVQDAMEKETTAVLQEKGII